MPSMSLIRIQFLKVHILLSRNYGFVKMRITSTTDIILEQLIILKTAYYAVANQIICSFFFFNGH